MKKDSWGEFFEHQNTSQLQPVNDQEIYLVPEGASVESLEEYEDWDDEEFDDDEDVSLYSDEAHEALNRLNQKTNKRGGMMRQPRRAETWQ